MSELRIGGVGAGAESGSLLPGRKPGAAERVGFGDALRQALGQVNELQRGADQATQAFSLGQSRDVAGTLIAIEKANLGFQLTLQLRNRLLEAYQEIMRMPV
jgi:flagellar hook-basal body complex protein FliE